MPVDGNRTMADSPPRETRRPGVQTCLRLVKGAAMSRSSVWSLGLGVQETGFVDSLNLSISMMRSRTSQGATAERVVGCEGARCSAHHPRPGTQAREILQGLHQTDRQTDILQVPRYIYSPPCLPRISLPRVGPDCPELCRPRCLGSNTTRRGLEVGSFQPNNSPLPARTCLPCPFAGAGNDPWCLCLLPTATATQGTPPRPKV